MNTQQKNNKLAFYSGLIYFVIMSLFFAIKLMSYFDLFNFAYSGIILKILIQIGLMFVLPVCFYCAIFKTSLKQTFFYFGFKKTSFKSVYVSIIIGIFVFVLVCYFSAIWSSLLSFLGFKFSSSQSDYSVLSFFLSLIFVCILPAICEETTHRGLLLNGMKKHGAIRAIVLTGLLFGFMHFNIVQFGYAFLVGMLLCLVTLLSHSIIPAMIIHFVNNFLSLFTSFSQNSSWLKSDLINSIFEFFNSTSALTSTIMRLLLIFISLYIIIWGITKLLKEGKKQEYLTFKNNLKKQLQKQNLEDKIDTNDDRVVMKLYQEIHLINLEKQLVTQKISIKDLLDSNTKKATELVLSENMTSPQTPNRKSYIFIYLAIILGTIGTVLSFVLGII